MKKQDTIKRNFRVIVKNSENEIVVCHLFTSKENAFICFEEFSERYWYFKKIIIEAVQV